jgi:nucleoside triphosphate diphosphatase
MPDPPLERAAAWFTRLVEVMRTLRAPDGCPWDREQTWRTLAPFVLEETYEVLDAIDRRDVEGLKQEIGDLLFEAVFLAQVASEAGHFDVADSLESIVAKLVRRHPHVFARQAPGSGPATPRDVEVRWEELKAAERAAADPDGADRPHTTLSGIPRTLPSLLRAYEIGQRASAVGFDWNRPAEIVPKVREELDELMDAVEREGAGSAHAEEEMGDLLFALANLSRKLGIEPEAALRKANDKFTRRFDRVESEASRRGGDLRALTLADLEREWERVKRDEREGSD